jgi:2-polyprenyl-6-methoxyphenol hydroxylase-like FAD-dependent oxidoreductase
VPAATVIGGNFSGMAAGLALTRAGFDVAVYEQAPSLDRVQSAKGGLHLWPNAIRALDVLGVGEDVRSRAIPFDRSEMATAEGRVLTSWRLDEFRQRSGFPTVHILRAELHRALAEGLAAAAPGAVRTGTRCEGFTQDGERVTARFADGSEARSDVLVGADGMKSVIRAQLLGPPELKPSGGATIRGDSELANGDDLPLPLRSTRVYLGRGKQFGLNRLDERRVTWFLRVADVEGSPEDLDAVREQVRGWADPIERVLEATDPATISRAETYDAPKAPKWGEGRVTLAGDAAHPMLNSISQGAAQGLEDGAVLQLVFAERGTDDIPRALRAYEERRIARVYDFVKRSRMIGDMAIWRNPIACAGRSIFMQVANPVIWKQTQSSATAAF